MSTAGYLVVGLTCRRCLAKVLEKVRSLAGVTNVAMDLGASGLSPLLVMSGTTLAAASGTRGC
jgi:copper chaperone CopZ